MAEEVIVLVAEEKLDSFADFLSPDLLKGDLWALSWSETSDDCSRVLGVALPPLRE